mgnify:CR=1 FL=1
MKQSGVIRLIDLFSFIVLVLMIATGILLEYTLPARSGSLSVWGMTRHEWGGLHYYISLLFLMLMVAHLFLHVKFIKSAILGKATREQNYRIAVGVVALLTILALAFLPVISSVEGNKRDVRPYHDGS